MIITDLTQEQLNKIEEFVAKHSNGNFFHSSTAFKFFQTVENYKPVLVISEDNNKINGALSAVIIKEPGIKGNFSSRCVVWGGPVCDTIESADLLINELTNYVSSKAIYTEFRNMFNLLPLKDAFTNNGYSYEEHINFLFEVESTEANRKKLNENRRRQLNKGFKSGARIIQPENIDQVKQFYYILKDLFTRKVKKPLPPFDFFKKFFEHKECGTYLFIEYENNIIGGIMCPVYKETIYEWYIGALDPVHKDQSPSVMATWAAIDYAANNGLKYFDFMGAGKPDEHYGVREFKSKFGGKLVSFGRYTRVNKPFMYGLGKLGLKLLSIFK